MTEGMLAVMNRITELQKRFGLYKTESVRVQNSEGQGALNFSQMLQEQEQNAQISKIDDSSLPKVHADKLAENGNTERVPSLADLRSSVNRAATLASATGVQGSASYNTRSVIDLIMQDKRSVGEAVESFSKNARDVLQTNNDDSAE